MALGKIRGFAFDLDGTIWAGPALMRGAAELVAALRGAGLGVVFASNGSRHGSGLLARRLTDLGISAGPSDVVTAFDLVGAEVFRKLGPVRVLPIGTEDLANVLEASGHVTVTIDQWPEAQAVVIGNDPLFDFGRLRAAARAVAAGAAFFAVNMDARFPVGPEEFDPGCGALAEAIAVAAGARPTVIGKPYRLMFDVAVARLGCSSREAAMVGDNHASDIEGGRGAGMFTVWLDPSPETQVTPHADLIVRDLVELFDLWKSSATEPGRSEPAPGVG